MYVDSAYFQRGWEGFNLGFLIFSATMTAAAAAKIPSMYRLLGKSGMGVPSVNMCPEILPDGMASSWKSTSAVTWLSVTFTPLISTVT